MSQSLSIGALHEQSQEGKHQNEEDYENIQEEILETDEIPEIFIFRDFESLQTNVQMMNTTISNECFLLLNSISKSRPVNRTNIEKTYSKIHKIIKTFNSYFKNICILWLNEYSFKEKPNTIQLAYVMHDHVPFKGHYNITKIQLTNKKQLSSMLINIDPRENEFLEKRMGAFSYGFVCDNKHVKGFKHHIRALGISSDNRSIEIERDGTTVTIYELNLIAETMLKLIFENYTFPSKLLFTNIPFPKGELYYFPSSAVNMVTTEIYKYTVPTQESFQDYKRRILKNNSVYGLLSLLGKPQNKIFKYNEFGDIPVLEPTIESILELKKIQKFVGGAYYPSMLCRKLYEVLKQFPIINIQDPIFDFSKLDYALSTSYVDEAEYKIENREFKLEDFLSIYIDGIYSLFTSPGELPTMDALLVTLISNLNSNNRFCVQCGGGAFKIVGNIGKKNDCDSRIYVWNNNVDAYKQTIHDIKVEFMKLIYFLENNNYYNSTFLLFLGNYWIEIKKKEIRFREHTLMSGFPAHLLSIDVVSIVIIRKNKVEPHNGEQTNVVGDEVCSFEHYSAVFDIVIKNVDTKAEFEYVSKYKMEVQLDEMKSRGGGQTFGRHKDQPITHESIDFDEDSDDEDSSEPQIYIMNLLALLKTILETFEKKLNLYNRALQGKIDKDIERIHETLLIFERIHGIDIHNCVVHLNKMKTYIDENKFTLSQQMLANNSQFDILVNNLTEVLNEFIEDCETNNNRGPVTLNPDYVQYGIYETGTNIDIIKTFFSEITIKGVSYSSYSRYDLNVKPQDLIKEKTKQQKGLLKKIEENQKRRKERKSIQFDEKRGIDNVSNKTKESKKSLTRKNKIVLKNSKENQRKTKGRKSI
jgi:hypothetical protein